MIDHLTLPVSNYERSKAFYLAALEPIGYGLVMALTSAQIPGLPFPETCGIGPEGKPNLWLRPAMGPITTTHLAFAAHTHAQVEAFHRAALAAGGTDHGAPGLRPHYHPGYYGAFVLDPDGYNLEVVCHREKA